MRMQANVGIHNRFDIKVLDHRTGQVRQTATAYNIVLDNTWTTLCNGQQFFTHINFGQGSGTLDPARTSLFSQLASLSATTVETVKALPTSYIRKSITLPLGTYKDKTISEVGVYGTRLNTHALLEDSEGQPITIVVGEFDVITIYATVYSSFDVGEPLMLIGSPDKNSLIDYLVGGSAPAGVFEVGEGDGAGDPRMEGCQSSPALGRTGAASWTANAAQRKRTTTATRLATDKGNGHIKEIVFRNASGDPKYLFRAKLPIESVFGGQQYTAVPIGIGDGETERFLLPSRNVDLESVTPYINAAEPEDYDVVPVPSINHEIRVGFVGNGINDTDLSRDGKHIAHAHYSSEKPFSVMDIVGGSPIMRPDVPGIGGSGAPFIAISGNGAVVVAGTLGTFIWSGSTWTSSAAPSLPANINNIRLSYDGSVLAAGHAGGDYVTTFDRVANAWVQRQAPAVKPTASSRVDLTPDGTTMGAAFNHGNCVIVWDWSGGAWVARTTPNDIPTGAKDIKISPSGARMLLVRSASPYASVYDYPAGTWVLRDNPATPPAHPVEDADVSADGAILALVTGRAGSWLHVYDWLGGAWMPRPVTAFSDPYVQGFGKVRIVDSGAALIASAHGVYAKFTPICWIDLQARLTAVEFPVAPDVSSAVTADYMVKGIHKTDQYVIDFSFSIQFGEPAAED